MLTESPRGAGRIAAGLAMASVMAAAPADAQEVQMPGKIVLPAEVAEMFALPREYTTPCELNRSLLAVRELATASDYDLRKAERLDDGWAMYDAYSRRIVEMNDRLEEVAVWGRTGPGPLEYRGYPPGLGKTSAGVPFSVDNTAPPTVLLYGSRREEYALARADGHMGIVQDALTVGDGLFLTSRKGVFESVLGERRVALRWEMGRDFGAVVGPKGSGPNLRLRLGADGALYVATVFQSAVWSLNAGATPRKVLQRCVPDVWKNVHASAPTTRGRGISGPGFAISSVSIKLTRNTLADFAVLANGQVLALGGLLLQDGEGPWGRSLELYDSDGALVRAWALPLTGNAVFDPRDPRRLLTWGTWGGRDAHLEGVVRLVEVDGESYPAPLPTGG